MSEQREQKPEPADRLHPRDTADERPSPDQKERKQEPRRDHSEREHSGDQDIDTAGMIPGNKATDDTDPVGL